MPRNRRAIARRCKDRWGIDFLRFRSLRDQTGNHGEYTTSVTYTNWFSIDAGSTGISSTALATWPVTALAAPEDVLSVGFSLRPYDLHNLFISLVVGTAGALVRSNTWNTGTSTGTAVEACPARNTYLMRTLYGRVWLPGWKVAVEVINKSNWGFNMFINPTWSSTYAADAKLNETVINETFEHCIKAPVRARRVYVPPNTATTNPLAPTLATYDVNIQEFINVLAPNKDTPINAIPMEVGDTAVSGGIMTNFAHRLEVALLPDKSYADTPTAWDRDALAQLIDFRLRFVHKCCWFEPDDATDAVQTWSSP